MFDFIKYITDYREEDEKVVKHLLDGYETCYWCYWTDRHKMKDHNIIDRCEYLKDLDALEKVISYYSAGDKGAKACKSIRDSIQYKEIIAKGMSQ